jgi:hypothetical protein
MLSFSLTHTHTHSVTLSLSLSLSHTHTHSHTHSLSLSLSLSHTHTHTHTQGNGAVETSYPFACAAINVVFMLTDMMKLKRPGSGEARSNEPDAALMRAT